VLKKRGSVPFLKLVSLYGLGKLNYHNTNQLQASEKQKALRNTNHTQNVQKIIHLSLIINSTYVNRRHYEVNQGIDH
jgi:hypothetical protein